RPRQNSRRIASDYCVDCFGNLHGLSFSSSQHQANAMHAGRIMNRPILAFVKKNSTIAWKDCGPIRTARKSGTLKEMEGIGSDFSPLPQQLPPGLSSITVH